MENGEKRLVYKGQRSKASVNDRQGPTRVSLNALIWVCAGCLGTNFKASANGCSIPIKLTLFGPLRRWEYARTLRSKRVKRAIASNAATIVGGVTTKFINNLVFGWVMVIW